MRDADMRISRHYPQSTCMMLISWLSIWSSWMQVQRAFMVDMCRGRANHGKSGGSRQRLHVAFQPITP